jgi:hypothetical protein
VHWIQALWTYPAGVFLVAVIVQGVVTAIVSSDIVNALPHPEANKEHAVTGQSTVFEFVKKVSALRRVVLGLAELKVNIWSVGAEAIVSIPVQSMAVWVTVKSLQRVMVFSPLNPAVH